MRSKEEIFKNHFTKVSGKECDQTMLAHMNYCLLAMDEYGKELAVGFAEWIRTFKSLEIFNDQWLIESQITSEQLFNKYIESLNKITPWMNKN